MPNNQSHLAIFIENTKFPNVEIGRKSFLWSKGWVLVV